jgi:hypothetical protein
MRATFIRPVAVVCSALSLAFASPARPPLPPDPCSLLSASEINGVMGVDMGAPKALATKACQWEQPVKTGSAGAIVNLTLIPQAGYDMGKQVSGAFTATAVSGVGDDAYYSESKDGKITDLRAKKGSNTFAVMVRRAGMTGAEAKAKELALAKLIAPKL